MIETGKQVEEESERKTIFNCAKTVLTSRIKGWKEKLNEFGEKAKEVLIKHGGKIFLTSLLATQVNVARAESFNSHEEVETPYVVIENDITEQETSMAKDTKLDKFQISIDAMEENIERAKKSIEELEKEHKQEYEGHDTMTEVLFPNEAREKYDSTNPEKEEKDNAKMEARESITVDGAAKEISESLGNLTNSLKQDIEQEVDHRR